MRLPSTALAAAVAMIALTASAQAETVPVRAAASDTAPRLVVSSAVVEVNTGALAQMGYAIGTVKAGTVALVRTSGVANGRFESLLVPGTVERLVLALLTDSTVARMNPVPVMTASNGQWSAMTVGELVTLNAAKPMDLAAPAGEAPTFDFWADRMAHQVQTGTMLAYRVESQTATESTMSVTVVNRRAQVGPNGVQTQTVHAGARITSPLGVGTLTDLGRWQSDWSVFLMTSVSK